jgi:hypothetical protein
MHRTTAILEGIWLGGSQVPDQDAARAKPGRTLQHGVGSAGIPHSPRTTSDYRAPGGALAGSNDDTRDRATDLVACR